MSDRNLKKGCSEGINTIGGGARRWLTISLLEHIVSSVLEKSGHCIFDDTSILNF